VKHPELPSSEEVRRAVWDSLVWHSKLFGVLLRCARKRDWNACARVGRVLFRSQRWSFAFGLVVFALAAGLDHWIGHGAGSFMTGIVFGAAVVLFAGLYLDELRNFLGRLLTRSTTTETAGPPPRTAQYLLFLVPPKYRDNLVGDLEEEYQTLLPTYGRQWTDRWYWWQVVAAFGHFLLRLLTGLAAVWRLIR